MKESVRCFVASGEHSGIRSKNSRHTISLLVTNPRITEKECSVKYFYFYKKMELFCLGKYGTLETIGH